MSATQAPARKRRSLRFDAFDEVIADAERAHEQGYVALGNWSLGKALAHLGLAMDASIDGVPFPTTLRTRILGRLVIRYMILYWQFPPGARLPRKTAQAIVPEQDVPYDEGIQVFQRGIARLAAESQRTAHPVIGKLSTAQWDRFHLRHAELHLSFFDPLAKHEL